MRSDVSLIDVNLFFSVVKLRPHHLYLTFLISSANAIAVTAVNSSWYRQNHVPPRSVCLFSCFRALVDAGYRVFVLLAASRLSFYQEHERLIQKPQSLHLKRGQQRLVKSSTMCERAVPLVFKTERSSTPALRYYPRSFLHSHHSLSQQAPMRSQASKSLNFRKRIEPHFPTSSNNYLCFLYYLYGCK